MRGDVERGRPPLRIERVRDHDRDDRDVHQNADRPEQRLADCEGEHEVEEENSEIQERLEEPSSPQRTYAAAIEVATAPCVDELIHTDRGESDEKPSREVAERHAEIQTALGIIVDLA